MSRLDSIEADIVMLYKRVNAMQDIMNNEHMEAERKMQKAEAETEAAGENAASLDVIESVASLNKRLARLVQQWKDGTTLADTIAAQMLKLLEETFALQEKITQQKVKLAALQERATWEAKIADLTAERDSLKKEVVAIGAKCSAWKEKAKRLKIPCDYMIYPKHISREGLY
jgi:chromosome segregation ATPase